MASIACPHCGEKTFSWWDKYLTGKWGLLRCTACKGRVCAQPIVLAVLYFLYVWDVVLFGYLAYLDSLWYLLVMLVGWLILDYFSVYVPLTALRTAGLSKAEPAPDLASKDQSNESETIKAADSKMHDKKN
ncbi:MAG: hypothetical protein COB30_020710 [Ectothiorhodospiraceae bacterium]|nr:hypothetical protein [Ectothiorhodospiraceae bacterium]